MRAATDGRTGGGTSYAYDAGDQRVLKTAIDSSLNERHTVYVFETLELRRAAWLTSGTPDYDLTEWTEVAFLSANGVRLARLAWDETDVPTLAGGQLHVLLELGDHLGSTSVVIDKASGELVERGTYQAYGGAESDYRPGRWKGFREDYGFTGKEEDVAALPQHWRVSTRPREVTRRSRRHAPRSRRTWHLERYQRRWAKLRHRLRRTLA